MDVTVQLYPERGRKSHKMVLWSIKTSCTAICSPPPAASPDSHRSSQPPCPALPKEQQPMPSTWHQVPGKQQERLAGNPKARARGLHLPYKFPLRTQRLEFGAAQTQWQQGALGAMHTGIPCSTMPGRELAIPNYITLSRWDHKHQHLSEGLCLSNCREKHFSSHSVHC